LPLDEILRETKKLENEAKQIKHDLLKIVWYMRGGVTITEAYEFGPEDREVVKKVIDDNLETTKKSGLPFF